MPYEKSGKKSQEWGKGGITGGKTKFDQIKLDNKFNIIDKGGVYNRNITDYNGQWNNGGSKK